MDISAFSEDDFDSAQWINKTFKRFCEQQPQHSKEAVVSNLVSKLQLYVQQVNLALEDTSQKVLATMPKIMKDSQNLGCEALTLRAKMFEVQNEIAHVQRETGVCMENIERLDRLKTKLQISKQGIQESDGWGRLTSDLEELLERNEIIKACEKLQSLQLSVIAQKGLSGQLDRESQVEGFKNRIEALTSPAIVQCFTTGDIEQSKKFVLIFINMERLPQLTHYYRTVQKDILQKHWSELCELAINSTSINFLHEFYDYLIENCQKQIKWCTNVFSYTNNNNNNNNCEPISVLTELLLTLQPSRETILTNFLKRSNDKIFILQEFSNANIYVGNVIQKQINESGLKPSTEQLRQLSIAIYDYFNIFIQQYGSIEKNILETQLDELNIIQLAAADTIRTIGNSNTKIFQWIDGTIQRCTNITQNCALPAVINAIKSLLLSFLERYKKAQQQLHASRSTEQDWSFLQICISLLQYIGDFKLQVEELEHKLCDIITEKSDEIKNRQAHDFVCFLYKISTKRELYEFSKLFEISKISQSKSYTVIDTAAVAMDDIKELAIFASVFEKMKPICEYIHDTMLASIFSPIEIQLKSIEPSESINSSGSDLPDYSFAPQEFITQIGQYLLTLPQNLEPLLLSPSQQLKTALELCDQKYSKNTPSADILLLLLTDECCALYEESISQICSLNTSGAKQIATDIEYLNSVLEELGLNLGSNLLQTAALLRAPAEKYLALSSGCNPKLVTAIRQMRNIISTE